MEVKLVNNREGRPVLKGDAAIALWRAGKDEWNKWSKSCAGPVDVDFSGVDFGDPTVRGNLEDISFEYYEFPNAGKVYFTSAKFGKGSVNFREVVFGEGIVSFEDTKFEEGDVNFEKATFGEGEVSFFRATFGAGCVGFDFASFGKGVVEFSSASFGEGYVSFTGASFGEGFVTFFDTKFGEGLVFFLSANFGKGDVSFYEANFGEGDVSFSRGIFGEGKVSFDKSKFGKGKVQFNQAEFGDGDVSFYGARFGDGDVNFESANFGIGSVSFKRCLFGESNISFTKIYKFPGHFIFTPEPLPRCLSLNFSAATFDANFIVEGLRSSAVLNLCHSKLAYPLELDTVNFDYQEDYKYLIFQRALYGNDSASFRRLKKIAKENDDHERALDFFAKEMRTAYWHSITGPKLVLYYLYDWLSDYGRSIVRPLIGLFITAWIYAEVYLAYATEKTAEYWDGVKFSASHVLPIYPGVRESRQLVGDALFGTKFVDAPWWLSIVTTSQYLISSVLLFLLILAFRNRFRS